MYRNLRSTILPHLARSRVQFRHAYTQRSATPVIRLMLIQPNAATQRGLHIPRQLLRSEIKPVNNMAEEASKTVKEQTVAAAAKPKKTIWQKVKEEATHYWDGTKLLGLEIKISSSLTWKLMNGGKLTRREHRQVSNEKKKLINFY